MKSKVIVKKRNNIPPEEEVNKAIEELGEGWRVVQSQTALAVFVGAPLEGVTPLTQVCYVTTVVMQKD